uniref:BZIP domain-containing protein n=1 Tax=Leersia perrieri TaxID=77586 RepID=A0A0D9XG57_9ORYZ
MAMEDDEDMWANTTSPSTSPPRPAARVGAGGEGGFISTALSLNSTCLHGLLSSSPFVSASPPCHAAGVGNGGYRNAAATPSFFSAAAASYHHGFAAVVDGAAIARQVFDHETCGAGDRRKKRMIKNRESAARSRARKQARVDNLETEVELLKKENKMLRVKYEQLRKSVEVPVPVRRTLQRVLSAPF